MAYQRVTLATLRAQLKDALGSNGTFWTESEIDSAVNEAVAIWQLLTGDLVTTVISTIGTGENLFSVPFTDTNGVPLSVYRVYLTEPPVTTSSVVVTVYESDEVTPAEGVGVTLTVDGSPFGTELVTGANGVVTFTSVPAGTAEATCTAGGTDSGTVSPPTTLNLTIVIPGA